MESLTVCHFRVDNVDMCVLETTPKTCVIVPNYNGMSHLEYSLESLSGTRYPSFDIVIVDDHSDDGSVEYITANYPGIHVITNSRSRGFAGAVNLGILHAVDKGAEYIAICNNDIKVLPWWLQLSVGIFSQEDKAGLVGFREISEKEQKSFNVSDRPTNKVVYKDVAGLPGCLYVCPIKVFGVVGLYDEGYFMYGEDNDFFARLKKAGYRLLQTDIPVWHFGEGSTEGIKFRATWLSYRNALRFAVKNENIFGIFKMIISLIYLYCNPFSKKERTHPVFKRMRRYNFLINFMLVTGSCFWNLFHIFPTLKSRYYVEQPGRLQ